MNHAYSMSVPSFVLSERSEPYIIKVRDLPNEQKPRERLLQEGTSSLSSAELLAVVLGTGTIKEDVLEMANRIVQEYGERNVLFATDAKLLSDELGIPLTKALQIVACGELGKRYFRSSRNGAAVIRTAEDVYGYTADMRMLPKEHVRGLYLNTHYQIVHDETISIGTLDANLVHPREIFRPALSHAAAAVILVHNHPSGNSSASMADIQVTEQITKAGHLLGIELIDHVIVTADSFTSIVHAPRLDQ